MRVSRYRFAFLSILILVFLGSQEAGAGLGIFDKRPVQEQRQDILTRSNAILEELYLHEPLAKQAIHNAYGYATFSNFGMKILILGGGSGRGVAYNHLSGRHTFMKMIELQTGLGIGIKSFKLVWVFENRESFFEFIDSGWQLGAQSSVAAKYNKVGGALQSAFSVSPGVWVYQMTDKGLALELTAKGTKYFLDKKLNEGR